MTRVYNPVEGVGGGLLMSEGWIRDVLEPVRQKWFPGVPLYLKAHAHSAHVVAARLVGQWPVEEEGGGGGETVAKQGRLREIVVLRQPPCVQVFDVVEHGRRFYRTLVYASDVHRCLSSHEGDYNPRTRTCESKGGVPVVSHDTTRLLGVAST